jgi:hypothetical protein
MFKEVIKDMVQKERWILPVDMNRWVKTIL